MILMILMLMLVAGVVRAGFRLAWGMTKFIFGLGLFAFCPILFVLAAMFGIFGHMWLPILLIGLLCGRAYRRA